MIVVQFCREGCENIFFKRKQAERGEEREGLGGLLLHEGIEDSLRRPSLPVGGMHMIGTGSAINRY